MTQEYVRNCWYVIAASDEIGVAPVRRELMDDAVVLYRDPTGAAVALTDRCIHCGAPLSRGVVHAGTIACPYHGLVYDESGNCVRVPSQPHVPSGMRVRSFPTHDDGRFVWIWTGVASIADVTPPPRLPLHDGPSWAHFTGAVTVEAGYVLLHEHLLDITHFWVGTPESSPAVLRDLPPLGDVQLSETTVSYHRAQPPAPLVDWEAEATGLATSARYVHRDSATFISPGLQLLSWSIDAADGTSFEHLLIRALTPETKDRTRVSWLTAYNYADRRPAAIHILRSVVTDTIHQDITMVEMVQANRPDGSDLRPGRGRGGGQVALVADAAALRAVAIIRGMVATETTRRH